jgi:hypothetical protein
MMHLLSVMPYSLNPGGRAHAAQWHPAGSKAPCSAICCIPRSNVISVHRNMAETMTVKWATDKNKSGLVCTVAVGASKLVQLPSKNHSHTPHGLEDTRSFAYSHVFLPSIRCSWEIWARAAASSLAGIADSPALTAVSPPSRSSLRQLNS